ncbi:MAG: ABC transporter substrate-binding protein [Natronosporangium sp.]
MRTVLLGVTLVGLAAATGGCSAVLGGGRDPAPVVIGADLALTGVGSPLGTGFGNALRLRAEQVNQQRLLGDRRLELRLRDNRSDPRVAAANLSELVADPAVTAIVSGACGPCAVGLAGQLDQHRVPLISLAAGDQVVQPVERRRYLFQLGPRAGDDADLLAAGLDRAGAATVALVTAEGDYPGGDYGRAGRQEMAAAAERTGFEIVAQESVVVGDPASVTAAAEAIADWRPGLDQFDAPSGPDAVVIWTPPAEADQLATDLRQAGYAGSLHLDAIAAGQLYLPTGGLSGATLVFTDTPVADQLIAATPATVARQTWFRDYLAEYGTYHAHASWAADAIGVIADAVRRADRADPAGRHDPVDRSTLRDRIESTRRLDGLTGLIRYTADQHAGLHPESLTRLTAGDGRWHLAR